MIVYVCAWPVHYCVFVCVVIVYMKWHVVCVLCCCGCVWLCVSCSCLWWCVMHCVMFVWFAFCVVCAFVLVRVFLVVRVCVAVGVFFCLCVYVFCL